jgi:hypothetical protein
MKHFVVLFLFFFVSACAATSNKPAVFPAVDKQLAASKNEKIADTLTGRGHYLEASFYYEAALMLTADEKTFLPKLIVAQIRAGRLRAAGINVRRLVALMGDSPPLTRLAALIRRYAPSLDETSTKGEEVSQ